MYSYMETVKSDVKEWMEDNRDQWEGLDSDPVCFLGLHIDS